MRASATTDATGKWLHYGNRLEAQTLIWEWNLGKSRTNLRIHGIEFEAAILVFNDPLAETFQDLYPQEQRR